MVRAIRGAITVEKNSEDMILDATKELLSRMLKDNELNQDDIISIWFTMTLDLNAVFPAKAARELGLTDVALMCTNEIDVKNSLKKCIRIMISFNTGKSLSQLHHIYLKKAVSLRPDLIKGEIDEKDQHCN
jgi:chorismate mutase